ncbi:hypothetical protein PV10_03039 [Exophiala mesophila]|uniref:F-box domain-containing protein n=1 Tax=Exophiala mesophila TaxID=212818 RepID=A0A0D1X0R5_EXOME|nr:uncharacterized protein PV10_03039 [Exophiala mesophila]KIV95375.1 hypothetical protein PV10_03039 [Exophiala mesophila]
MDLLQIKRPRSTVFAGKLFMFDGACDDGRTSPTTQGKSACSIAIPQRPREPSSFGGNDFVNPFTEEDLTSRKTSASQDASSYFRPNAFLGHRDTFARLLHRQLFESDEEDESTESPYTSSRRLSTTVMAWLPYPVLSLILRYTSFEGYKSMRLVCRQWYNDLPPPSFPAIHRLPQETIQQFLSYLDPVDFDAARHTCASWFFASLNWRILRSMLKSAGCTLGFQTDGALTRERRRTNTLSQSSDTIPIFPQFYASPNKEWLCHKRLATEARLSLGWRGAFTLGPSPSESRLSLTDEIHFHQILGENTTTSARPSFTVSTCGKFVLIVHGNNISVYGLWNSEEPMRPIVKLAAGCAIFKVSMDTSADRYAVAAILSGRKGMLWELVKNSNKTRLRSSSGESLCLGMQATIHGSAITPVSQQVAANLSLLAPEQPADSKRTVSGNGFDPDFTACHSDESCQGLSREALPGSQEEEQVYGAPIQTMATALYTNLGSSDDPPRSVAICPNRKCVAFGSRMGIELHWIDALTGGDLNRWFPLAAPSDFLYFLPIREDIDAEKKLRLISSALGPKTITLRRSDSSQATQGPQATSPVHGRRQSMTRLFFGSLPFPAPTSSNRASPSLPQLQNEEAQGVLRMVDCDHYRAIPLSDGSHLLFIDALTGLLCLGSDAPLGGSTKLIRKAVFVPPADTITEPAKGLPIRYACGRDLR